MLHNVMMDTKIRKVHYKKNTSIDPIRYKIVSIINYKTISNCYDYF